MINEEIPLGLSVSNSRLGVLYIVGNVPMILSAEYTTFRPTSSDPWSKVLGQEHANGTIKFINQKILN